MFVQEEEEEVLVVVLVIVLVLILVLVLVPVQVLVPISTSLLHDLGNRKFPPNLSYCINLPCPSLGWD